MHESKGSTYLQTIDPVNDQIKVRLEKLTHLMEQRGGMGYPNGYQPKDLAQKLIDQHEQTEREALAESNLPASVAGRIMAIRSFGKAAFVRIQDRSGVIQLYVDKKTLGEERYLEFKNLYDIGDIVYGEGHLFKTKTDEVSVRVDSLVLLTKSLHPLPEKFHGIADIEVKYRQRYLDLMMSQESRNVFMTRAKIVASIRKFFLDRDFIEVETPMLHSLVSGAAAKPFKTFHNTLQMDLVMRIAPECHLKRLVVGGLDRVFEINRNFRNEGMSVKHNPEFTMLEFYQAYATYKDLIQLTRELFQYVADEVKGTRTLPYQEHQINLDGNWEEISVEDAIIKYGKFGKEYNKADLRDREKVMSYCKANHYEASDQMKQGQLIMSIFDEEVEAQLIQPVFITHYPMDVSPLSRRNEEDPFLTDRFEIFIYGREMGNAFSELNDPFDQKQRFLDQVDAKAAGDEEACDMDEDYIRALEYGLPPTAGEGIGIDRMVMLFTNSASIRDVILFPQMRPQKKTDNGSADSE